MFRRFAAGLLALLSLGLTALAEGPVCVSGPGFAALVDESGADLTADGTFETAFTVRDGALYAAGSKGEYRLYDASGRRVSDEGFNMIRDAGDCLIFRRGSGFGAMDFDGSIILAPTWTQLVSNGAGGFLALDGDPLDDRPDEIVFIDAAGEVRRCDVYTAGGLSDVNDGRMPYLASDGRYGAVDGEGLKAIEPVWRWIGPFSGGIAAAEREGGRGMIDADGNAVVGARYDWLDRGGTMIAARSAEGIDVYASDASVLRFHIAGEGLQCALVGPYLMVSSDEWTRLYDADGAPIREAAAGAAFYPGLEGQVILSDGAWGEACQRLIDAEGAVVSDGFQRILPLAGGRYAWLRMPGTAYYSADLGVIQKSWDYDAARWGLLDDGGNTLSDAEYLEIIALIEDRLQLRTEDEILLSDADGRAIRRWPLNDAGTSS